MPYTWTGASALGFDLARRPGGAALADVLVAALAADESYALALAAGPAPDPAARAQALALVDAAQATGIVDLREVVGGPLAPGADPQRELAALAARAQAQRFGGAGDLLALVRSETLDHLYATVAVDIVEAAADRLTEALLGAMLGAAPPPVAAADLDVAALDPDRAPEGAGAAGLGLAYRAAGQAPQVDLGPYGRDVLDLLAGIRAGGLDDPYGLSQQCAPGPATGGWARAMHVASWAVELTGRTRAAAAAQLLCVQALSDAGFTSEHCALGVWNAASGMVVARVVTDLLPDDEYRCLVRLA